MDTFQFDLLSPEKLVFSGTVESVIVPGTEGDFEVLAHHAPLVSMIRAGFILVREISGSAERRIFVRDGFAEFSPAGFTILARQAIAAEDLTADILNEAVRDAETRLSLSSSDPEKIEASERLTHLKDVRQNHIA